MVVISSCAWAGARSGEPIDLCAYEIVFADEFDTLSVSPRKLDGTKWTAHTPWNGDFGDADFIDPQADGPFSVHDGKLHITARKDAGGKWRSGLLAAADSSGKGSGLRYGYFEARMKLPSGPGTWPAFWLMSLKPVANREPDIEIDVIEYYGHDTAAYHVASHVWHKGSQEARSIHGGDKIAVPPQSLTTRYHDYGVRVDPEHITYYLDRRPVSKAPTPREHAYPLYPLVNLALGSGYPIADTPDPSILLVEHVRIYRPKQPTARDGCRRD